MPDQISAIGTMSPEDYAQQQAATRQQQMAQLLMQQGVQGQQQPAGQMVSGRYVPNSFFQNLVPLANMAASQYVGGKADTEMAKLAERLRTGKEAERLAALQQIKAGNPIGALELPNVYGGAAPYQSALIEQVAPKKPAAIQEFEYAQQNPAFNQYQTNLKRAGAPNVTTIMGKSIAGEIGPMMKDAQGIAQAAVKTEDSANRIIQAVDSNKLFSGTAANVRLGAAQLADTLGVGGKDLQTKIGNTRQAMQGLAELTLQGRQQMRGQGAITESESKLAERAISGDITFTPTEIKQLANAAKRSADYTYKNYETKLGEMAKNPDTAGLVPYYHVPRMTQATSSDNTNTGGWSVKKVQ